MAVNYKDAGVNIEAGEKTVDKIKGYAKSTFNENVLSGIGHFGAFYQIDLKRWKNPVLVSSVDGVGTKIKIAFKMNRHDTIGQDLVNHCVNDIAVCGAEPQYFMDYLAFGKLEPEKAEQIFKGFSIACKENGVALIGGETAEMPGLYAPDEYDISGTIVGIVEKEKIIDGSRVKKGDALIGLPSTGLHTNGYSLARKALFDKFKPEDKFDEFEGSLGDELLKIHKSYLKSINILKENLNVAAFSHITGGGIIGNTKRVVPEGLTIKIDWNSWEVPPIFKLIQKTGEIDDEEMRHVFNLGIGLIAILDKNDVDKALDLLKTAGEHGRIIGEIV
ncbi:phosphoribosylformylglycinamidine cyclo-ligase [Melioribacter roseus P3M-2]|uniref:Phosphoribosylformylglycinamidine cyclo-ligase n=1 Tax=Melioribacter roseus (strain DSM 23840 / JCM 17771 / VKM B-2668 / P3M-2) TaxID=1191523 RepID=I7A0A6_MELRP|nr:phosphoribosylformylglycinamidine cyclo-ligase [Melioribacter roseus]AFN74693.1 phosphoribosylformylglycinamidine cyclo-ligase [Melioribacter roseus P3M-2]